MEDNSGHKDSENAVRDVNWHFKTPLDRRCKRSGSAVLGITSQFSFEFPAVPSYTKHMLMIICIYLIQAFT